MDDYSNVFYSIKNQNIALENTKNILLEKYSVDDKRTEFQLDNLSYIKRINTYLFYFYIFIIVVISISLLFSKRNYSFLLRFIIILCFIIYPFVILWIETTLYELFKYTFAIIFGKVYDPPNKPLTVSDV